MGDGHSNIRRDSAAVRDLDVNEAAKYTLTMHLFFQ